MSAGGIFCTFFLFYNFWRHFFFFLLVDSKDCYILRNMSCREDPLFLLSFLLMHCLKFYCFLLLRWNSSFCCVYAVIPLSWNVFFSLGLICDKCFNVLGAIHKGCPHIFSDFWPPLPLSAAVLHFFQLILKTNLYS